MSSPGMCPVVLNKAALFDSDSQIYSGCTEGYEPIVDIGCCCPMYEAFVPTARRPEVGTNRSTSSGYQMNT
jgi:hypothetical protein